LKPAKLNISLYNFLDKTATEDAQLNAELIQLSQKEGEQDVERLTGLRKQIAEKSQQVKMYEELKAIF
jgi:hypothetical protein